MVAQLAPLIVIKRLAGQDGAVGRDFGGKLESCLWPIQRVFKDAKAGVELQSSTWFRE